MSFLPVAHGSNIDDIDQYGTAQQKREWEALQHFRDKSNAAQARTMGGTGTNIDNDRLSTQGVLQGDYKNAMGLAQQAALGQGTSAAMAQQQAGQLAARNAQVAMANSGGGSRFAHSAAMQNAAQQSGQMQQSASAMNEALRAQEMAAGRQQYSQMSDAYQTQLRNLRGSEIGMQQGNQALNDQAAINWEAMRAEEDINNANWRLKQRQQSYAEGQAQTAAENATGDVMQGVLTGGAQAVFKMGQAQAEADAKAERDKQGGTSSDINVKNGIDLSDPNARHLLSQWRRR